MANVLLNRQGQDRFIQAGLINESSKALETKQHAVSLKKSGFPSIAKWLQVFVAARIEQLIDEELIRKTIRKKPKHWR